jgi:hypothetical protein
MVQEFIVWGMRAAGVFEKAATGWTQATRSSESDTALRSLARWRWRIGSMMVCPEMSWSVAMGRQTSSPVKIPMLLSFYTTLLHDPAQQVTYYHPGLGTMEPAGALTTVSRRATKILGMALGYGLANDLTSSRLRLKALDAKVPQEGNPADLSANRRASRQVLAAWLVDHHHRWAGGMSGR